MVVIDMGEEAKMIEIRGRLGKPNGFGDVYFGWSDFGDWFEQAGIYQKRPSQNGQYIVKMKHYWCANNQHENQQIWRGVFADGVDAWKALTTEQKEVWKKKKWPRNMLGFHRFMHYYLKNYSEPADLQIGDEYEGGIIFYLLQDGDTGYDPDVQHGLIAPAVDQSSAKIWHITADGETGATDTSIGTGNSNTSQILSVYGSEDNAAKLCADLSYGGYDDWFLPSKDELEKMVLQKVFLDMSDNDWFWSSSESSVSSAICVSSQFGQWTTPSKSTPLFVRACRTF